VSYCGLTSALNASAEKQQRGPISKQRNPHLQTVLIEAAKLAPRWNQQLAAVHERELKSLSLTREMLPLIFAIHPDILLRYLRAKSVA